MWAFRIYLFLLVVISQGYGQTARMELTMASMQAGNASMLGTGYQYSRGLAFTNTIIARSQYFYFQEGYAISNLPIGLLYLRAEQSDRVYPTFQLTTYDQEMAPDVILNQMSSGSFNIRYELLNLQQYALKAGEYHNLIQLEPKNNALFSQVSPNPTRFDLVIPRVVSPNFINRDVTLNINQLSYYRNGFTYQVPFNSSVYHSVPVLAEFNSHSPYFNFSSPQNTIQNNYVEVSKLQLHGGKFMNNTFYRLSDAQQFLWQITDIPVGNRTQLYYGFQLSSTDLRSTFLHPGTYSTQIQLRLMDANDHRINRDQAINVHLEIQEMTEFHVSSNQVDLALNSAVAYLQGVNKDYAGHLVLSKNGPFQVTVRSNSAWLYNGPNRIPASTISIGPVGNDPRITHIEQLSYDPQTLILSSTGIIDGSYNIRYSIRPSAAHQLIHLEKGRYTGLITYSITAL